MRKAGGGEEGLGELHRQGLGGRSEPDPLEGKQINKQTSSNLVRTVENKVGGVPS